jgi:DNA-binding NarL/FixJ family response regulator
MKLRVIVADDHPVVLAGLRPALERDGHIEVVGVAGGVDELIELMSVQGCEIVISDFSMPGHRKICHKYIAMMVAHFFHQFVGVRRPGDDFALPVALEEGLDGYQYDRMVVRYDHTQSHVCLQSGRPDFGRPARGIMKLQQKKTIRNRVSEDPSPVYLLRDDFGMIGFS